MRYTPAAGGWLAHCACGWESYSTTRRVVEQRGRAHEAKCGEVQ